jgi:prepilin-type N-terminal cleavage/methylation domain-containing protein
MKRAFTLAEVLITLGIIGVVAALVMPNMIANYNKKEYVARLQKAVSVWDNGIKLMLANDGVEYFSDSEFARTLVDLGINAQYPAPGNFPEATRVLKKYFNIIDVDDSTWNFKFDTFYGTSFTFSPCVKLSMSDGTTYCLYLSNLGDIEKLSGWVAIDVNGDKNPNLVGRDVFDFNINKYGGLIPYASGYWKDNPMYCGIEGSTDTSMIYMGIGCAARIIQNGWVMDY